MTMSNETQKSVLDRLWSTETGAGLTILRNIVTSTNSSMGGSSIEPDTPLSPNVTPKYVWDKDDQGQVWLVQKAVKYGLSRFAADAWSAPSYLKTNMDDTYGGYICGVTDASCSSGD